MTFPSSYSFYVTVLSQDDKDEFPNNHPNRFKNRVPRPIRFVGSDWQVGLVSLSLLTVPAVGESFVAAKDPLLYMRWHEHVLDTDDNQLHHQRRELTLLGQHMTKEDLLVMGQQFFKTLIQRYEQERTQRVVPQSQLAENNGTKLYPTFEWTREGDLVLNAANVDYTHQVAKVEWGKVLALQMGWIVEPTPDMFCLRPCVIQEFRSDTIPTPTDVLDAGNQPTFWSVDGQYFQVSMSCNWQFVILNAKFHPTTEFAPTRSLFVHCNAGTNRMVGNQVTDVLREIQYQTNKTTHFEPQHIHYLPVRSGLMEIIETHVTETNDDPVAFAKSQTFLTQSCQPTRISPKSSQFVQDSFTASPPFAQGSMASGVECCLVAGHASQHVRFAQERRSRPEHLSDPRHSPFHQARVHRDSRNPH